MTSSASSPEEAQAKAPKAPKAPNTPNTPQAPYQAVLGQKNITSRPLEYYQPIYQGLQPAAISERTGLEFDTAAAAFVFTLAGLDYQATWPNFTMASRGKHPDGSDYERILMLRYLCEGQLAPATGKELHYRDMQMANFYEQNFNGRVIRRLVGSFAQDLDGLSAVLDGNAGFKAQPLPAAEAKCDLAYRLEVLDGLPVSLRLWRADEEFAAAAQLLFDESLRLAFSAEDLSVVGGILVDHLLYLRRLAQAE
ncbi:MAG: DUF3786 domain-containing protein [Coriobacteriia bacterium]|nr:DUF3786 domain-containing protein [Coriobacteriia bacterium]